MSIRGIQLVKWAFPVAAIISLFWYRRRRIDRVDPGGKQKVDREPEKVITKSEKNNILYDSGITFDNTLINISKSSSVPIMANSKRVSENLDMPNKSSSQPTSSIPWYVEDKAILEAHDVVLESNPKPVEMISKSKKEMESTDEVETKSEESFEKTVTSSNEEPLNDSNDKSQTAGQQMSDRDSANHSPVSATTDVSVIDENTSQEESSDSGKGESINERLKSQTMTLYEFTIPSGLVGRLIGKRGVTIKNLNDKANVHMVVNDHPTWKEVKICTIEGLPDNTRAALQLVRQKFPIKKFPNLTLEEVHILNKPEEVAMMSDIIQLYLIDGINNDVFVCHILEPNRLFIQFPGNHSYSALGLLDYNMTQLYSTMESPLVPDQLSRGMIVVAHWYGRWVRGYIEQPDPEGRCHLVRLLDYGGISTFSNAEMRKIRADYLALPFQALEVRLANIRATNEQWSQEAYDVVAQICSNRIGQAQVVGYMDNNVYISLYMNIPTHGIISLADELVARGFAEPVGFQDMLPHLYPPIPELKLTECQNEAAQENVQFF